VIVLSCESVTVWLRRYDTFPTAVVLTHALTAHVVPAATGNDSAAYDPCASSAADNSVGDEEYSRACLDRWSPVTASDMRMTAPCGT
jgi:hypothetical protein